MKSRLGSSCLRHSTYHHNFHQTILIHLVSLRRLLTQHPLFILLIPPPPPPPPLSRRGGGRGTNKSKPFCTSTSSMNYLKSFSFKNTRCRKYYSKANIQLIYLFTLLRVYSVSKMSIFINMPLILAIVNNSSTILDHWPCKTLSNPTKIANARTREIGIGGITLIGMYTNINKFTQLFDFM